MWVDEKGKLVVNKNKDKITLRDTSINITGENGVKVNLPYDKTIIEKDNKIISFDDKKK